MTIAYQDDLSIWTNADWWENMHKTVPVSYTHLDVYKRQVKSLRRSVR